MQNFRVFQGSKISITITLRDSNKVVITAYDGTQTALTTLWQGDDGPPLFTPTTIWLTISPTANRLGVLITGEQTASVSPGSYTMVTKIDDAGEWIDAYACTITILPFAGATP